MKLFAVLLLCVGFLVSIPYLRAQDGSFLGAPAACAVALKQDLNITVKTSSQKMAYLGIIDEKTYEVLKREADTGGSYGIISGTGNFSQFEDKRTELYKLTGYHFDESNAESTLSLVTSTRAYTSFDSCMHTLVGQTIGFHAWKSSEDQNDVIVSCVYNAPPPGPLSRFEPKKKLRVKILSASASTANKDPSLNQKLGPGDHCQPIIVNRKGTDSIKLTVGIEGYEFINIDSYYGAPLPPNMATVSWTPLIRTEDTVTYDQTSDLPPSNSGTFDEDGKGACPPNWPAPNCSPDGKHLAAAYSFVFGPPADGDLIDPGQQQLAHARSVHGDGSEQFCDQYSIKYQEIYQPRPGYEGKHWISILTRCWSHPALWSATVRGYHMIPATVATSDDPVHFTLGEDILLRVPEKMPSSISFRYGNGKVATLKPGESSSDGKIKFAKATNFAGKDLYVYNYLP